MALGGAAGAQAAAYNFSSVSAGGFHTCAVQASGGQVVCWGDNSYGQTTVPAGLGAVSSVAAGYGHTCAVQASGGQVVCWGYNAYGQTNVPAGLGAVSSVSAGYGHTCAVQASGGQVVCWGYNAYGQADPPNDLGAASSVSAGVYHTCAVQASGGQVVCWGYSGFGQTDVPADLGAVASVWASYGHTCAVQASGGQAVCWGSNNQGETSVPAGLGAVSSVEAGFFHTCAVQASGGQVVCWGDNSYGQTNVPADLGAVSSVAAGEYHNCAVKASGGQVVCWGSNSDGQTTVPSAPAPSDTTAPVSTITLSPAAPNGSAGWYTTAVGASVTASDAVGVTGTRCSVDQLPAPTSYDQIASAGSCSALTVSGEGAHTIYAASTDAAGNKEAVVTQALKIDTVKPALAPAISGNVFLGQTTASASPNATDATSGVASQSCPALDTSTAGTHTITCTATDNAGNTQTKNLSYLVQYKIGAFLSPAPASKWKVGQTVPVKIQLTDNAGRPIPDTTAAALVANTRSCQVSFSATGAQNLAAQCMKYSAADHQFIYNWTLAKSPAGADTITITLSYPGSTLTTTRSQTITITT